MINLKLFFLKCYTPASIYTVRTGDDHLQL
jgi:hypothetical protein